jgi:hypothetical protein
MTPEKFEEIVTTVLGWFAEASEPSRHSFKNSTEDELIRYHHTLGRDIRNDFCLWQNEWEPKLVDGVDMSENHPDAISQRIIVEVWRRVNES